MKMLIIFSLLAILLATYFVSYSSYMVKVLVIISLYAAATLVVQFSNLRVSDIGLSKDTTKQGILYALPFMVLIFTGGLFVYFIQPELFQDSRYDLSVSSMLITIFLVIPFFTVLVEEIVFRGVLLGSVESVYSQAVAIIISSIAFGFWHMYSAQSLDISFVSSLENARLVSIIFVVIITTLAGVILALLKIKSGSLITPILVHWAINSTGVFLAFLAWR